MARASNLSQRRKFGWRLGDVIVIAKPPKKKEDDKRPSPDKGKG